MEPNEQEIYYNELLTKIDLVKLGRLALNRSRIDNGVHGMYCFIHSPYWTNGKQANVMKYKSFEDYLKYNTILNYYEI